MSAEASAAPAVNLLTPPESSTPAPAASSTAATPAPAAPWTWANESGEFSEGWHEKLGDEFKGNTSLTTLKGLPQLAKAYLDTKAMVGTKLAPPGEGSTPEQVAAWRKVVGAPDAPDGYGKLMPEGFPAELWHGDLEQEFTALAHRHHLSPAAVKEIAALQAKGTLSTYESETARLQESIKAGRADLAKEWGDQFERRATEAKALAARLGIEESDDIFLTRPDLVKKLAAAAPTLLGPDQIVQGTAPTISGGIQQQIDTLLKHPDYTGPDIAKAKLIQSQIHKLMDAADQLKKSNRAA